jgi:hypothetical protein
MYMQKKYGQKAEAMNSAELAALQFMPLSPITPDIHQVIEHRVGEVKGDVSNAVWKVLKGPGNPRLLLRARTYQ